ncbi:cochaperone Pam16 [Tuber magnatum]|uniref:Mitochondrial import inner membrane translocase subunit TIM16 n=1 Tax=Tuber magnatum TaxID=42249 RepID=A0A317SZZ7_9PEZI|nr:cochaperone Pam16 [Tuber magnatum]
MAHRIITQIALVGTRVIGRAFVEAWRQAQATQKYAKATSTAGTNTTLKAHAGLTLDEACRILNVKPPQNGVIDETVLMERFKKLFDANEPGKGGSFYLQSKVLRARERIESEVREAEEKARRAEELEKGWKPRVYK